MTTTLAEISLFPRSALSRTFAQELPEPVKINRLSQMRIKSSLLRAPSIRLLPPTGQRYEHDALPSLQHPNAASHFISVQSWHANIQEGNLRFKALDKPKGRLTIWGAEHLMPIQAQEGSEALKSVRVVVRYQYAAPIGNQSSAGPLLKSRPLAPPFVRWRAAIGP